VDKRRKERTRRRVLGEEKKGIKGGREGKKKVKVYSRAVRVLLGGCSQKRLNMLSHGCVADEDERWGVEYFA